VVEEEETSEEDSILSQEIYYVFCGEDKGDTTRICQVTIQKQKEITEAEA
jgi:hypothetical protein